jgi:hypothetical protein
MDRMSVPPCTSTRQACYKAKRRVGVVLAAAGPQAPSGGVARQGVALADLRSLVDCR